MRLAAVPACFRPFPVRDSALLVCGCRVRQVARASIIPRRGWRGTRLSYAEGPACHMASDRESCKWATPPASHAAARRRHRSGFIAFSAHRLSLIHRDRLTAGGWWRWGDAAAAREDQPQRQHTLAPALRLQIELACLEQIVERDHADKPAPGARLDDGEARQPRLRHAEH